MAQATYASTTQTRARREGTLRETVESIVVAFILAFVFRAFVVEAFIIPTGSMAPTLLGQHLRLTCPMCGYTFAAAPDPEQQKLTPAGQHVAVSPQRNIGVHCPMCHYPILERRIAVASGDRILVLKYVYAISQPQRWDVVVFKNPENPDVNYIKRLVGLPGERILIAGGDVYVREEADEPWRIARKPPDVQRAVWQPIYHSDYYPLDQGAPSAPSHRQELWLCPWTPVGDTADQWWPTFRGRMAKRTYVYRGAEERERPGVLEFRFTPRTALNYYAYNSLTPEGARGSQLISDLRVAASVVPRREELGVSLTIAAGGKQMRAVIGPEGRVLLKSRPRSAGELAPWIVRTTAEIEPLTRGEGTRLGLWHVDQALSLWVDRERVAIWRYHVDLELPLKPKHPPAVRIAVSGAALLRRVNLDRDLYYTQARNALYPHPFANTPLGTIGRPAVLGEDEFFVLGDNSPQSKDSRLWTGVAPWIDYRTHVPIGRVPRELMIGRAFFVYWPAMYRLGEGGVAFIPNFAHMRFID